MMARRTPGRHARALAERVGAERDERDRRGEADARAPRAARDDLGEAAAAGPPRSGAAAAAAAGRRRCCCRRRSRRRRRARRTARRRCTTGASRGTSAAAAGNAAGGRRRPRQRGANAQSDEQLGAPTTPWHVATKAISRFILAANNGLEGAQLARPGSPPAHPRVPPWQLPPPVQRVRRARVLADGALMPNAHRPRGGVACLAREPAPPANAGRRAGRSGRSDHPPVRARAWATHGTLQRCPTATRPARRFREQRRARLAEYGMIVASGFRNYRACYECWVRPKWRAVAAAPAVSGLAVARRSPSMASCGWWAG